MVDRSRRSAVQRKWVSRRYSHDWSPARTHHKHPPQDCNRARLESTERIGHRGCTRHMRNRLDYRYDPCPRNPRWCPVSNRGTRLDSSSYTHRIHHPIRRLGRCRSPHRKSGIGGLAQDVYTRLRALTAQILKTSITILAVRFAHAPLTEVGLVVTIGCADGAPSLFAH